MKNKKPVARLAGNYKLKAMPIKKVAIKNINLILFNLKRKRGES